MIDARLLFLERASARLILVEAGEMELEEAINGLVEQFDSIVGCPPYVEDAVDRWERNYPPSKKAKGRHDRK